MNYEAVLCALVGEHRFWWRGRPRPVYVVKDGIRYAACETCGYLLVCRDNDSPYWWGVPFFEYGEYLDLFRRKS